MMKIFVIYSWNKIVGLCSLQWSAMTLLKVCDAKISMTCFHEQTFNVFDCSTASTPAIRDMVTAAEGQDPHHLLILSIFFPNVTTECGILEKLFLFSIQL